MHILALKELEERFVSTHVYRFEFKSRSLVGNGSLLLKAVAFDGFSMSSGKSIDMD